MTTWANEIDKIKRFFWPSKEEWKALIIMTLAFAFIFSFNEWGTDSFDLSMGLKNFSIAFIIAGISVFIHEAGHRIMALKFGFRAETKLWWYGIIIGIVLTIITGGKLVFLAAHGIFIHQLSTHRLGYFRYGPNILVFGLISLMGPLCNIFFATIIKTADVWFGAGLTNVPFFAKLFIFNWILAAWNLLPIPPLDGSRMLFYSRMWYAFIFGAIGSYVILVYLFGIYSYFIAIALGAIIWLIYYLTVERKIKP